jgi:hypothetical protein
MNLVSLRPLTPRQNILLIEGVHDVLAEPTEELWHSWGQPEIWRVPHGHFSFSLIGAPCLMASRVLRWLSPRLNAPSVQARPNDAAR